MNFKFMIFACAICIVFASPAPQLAVEIPTECAQVWKFCDGKFSVLTNFLNLFRLVHQVVRSYARETPSMAISEHLRAIVFSVASTHASRQLRVRIPSGRFKWRVTKHFSSSYYRVWIRQIRRVLIATKLFCINNLECKQFFLMTLMRNKMISIGISVDLWTIASF